MITYYLENRKGQQFSFDSLNPRRSPLEFKPEKQTYGKQNQFGVITRGSFKQPEKKLSLKFDVVAESPDEFYFKLNQLAAFLYNQYNAPFYIYSVERRVRAKVSLEMIKENFKEGLETILGLDCVLELTMDDALWETSVNIDDEKILANGDTIEIDVGEDTVECAPIFQVLNIDSGINPEFALSVKNDDFGANMVLAANNFLPNSLFEVNCIDGKLNIDNISVAPAMIAGNYFNFLPGKNIVKYECKTNQSVKIKISYRLRRIF